eukprot:CAMPEP_0198692180 /NCGR_PEP_ID=MMETSP1468-20131203/220584_1 /TAXON_ID=1461545 /ORGANISM="Mantoniella sp, Strain CCMP1436" /LENGTH=85 /DNA_ID=CAMNT_0044445907 /DNA_START=624 /DNA_END=877 /DNA_ORIENTATION=-
MYTLGFLKPLSSTPCPPGPSAVVGEVAFGVEAHHRHLAHRHVAQALGARGVGARGAVHARGDQPLVDLHAQPRHRLHLRPSRETR